LNAKVSKYFESR